MKNATYYLRIIYRVTYHFENHKFVGSAPLEDTRMAPKYKVSTFSQYPTTAHKFPSSLQQRHHNMLKFLQLSEEEYFTDATFQILSAAGTHHCFVSSCLKNRLIAAT